MKVLLLMGSMKKDGNTAKVTEAFKYFLESGGVEVTLENLVDDLIIPCIGCAVCQDVLDDHGCIQHDDVEKIYHQVLDHDAFILATPIYSWYCTTPVKSLMDRLVYMMNKYYGVQRTVPFWKGKNIGLLTTCGYPDHYGADLFETGTKRYAKHSQLNYIGHVNARDFGKGSFSVTDEVKAQLKGFAEELVVVLAGNEGKI